MACDTEKIVRTDFPKGVSRQECEHAVREVMKTWPDESVAANTLHQRATRHIVSNGHEGEMARFMLSDFIRQCKQSPTINRTKTFWTIVHGLFTKTEALELYLAQCRSLQTRGQRRAIVEHLQAQGYAKREINAAIKKLTST